MGSLLGFTSYWKGIAIASTATLPLFGFVFFSKSNNKFDWKNASGINAHIKLSIVEEDSTTPSAAAAAHSSGGGNKATFDAYHIQQVSSSPTAATTTSQGKTTLSLVATMPLQYLDNSSYWKYCLPKDSVLKLNNATQAAAAQASAATNNENECEALKHISDNESSKEIDSKLLQYLLDLISRFIYLQHQVNTIFLFHSQPKNNNGNSANTKTASQDTEVKKVLEECKVDTTSSSTFRDLLLSPYDKPKNCVPFPFLVEMYLKVKKNNAAVSASAASQPSATGATTNTSKVTLDQIKQGELWGKISYALTDYWESLKKIKGVNSSSETPPQPPNNDPAPMIFEVPLILNYSLSETPTATAGSTDTNPKSFETLWEKYKNKTLTLGDYFQSKNGVTQAKAAA